MLRVYAINSSIIIRMEFSVVVFVVTFGIRDIQYIYRARVSLQEE